MELDMQLVTNKQKAEKLREAIALLEDADACMQAALGASDVCYDTHCAIQNIIFDLEADVVEFEKGLV
jgi:hypothetical protein